MSVYRGTNALVYVQSGSEDHVPVAVATSHTITETVETIPVNNKSTGTYEVAIPGRKSVTGTIEGQADSSDDYLDYKHVWKLADDRTTVKMIFANVTSSTDNSPGTGSEEFYSSGDFYFTDYGYTATDEETITWNASFTLSESGSFELFNAI